MFGNQFFCSFEPEANLDKELVMHQGYLLGRSYHGYDSISLLNCYGVRWQVEVKQTCANAMFVVRPIWSDFVNKKVLCFGRCLLNVTDRSRRAQTLQLVFVPKVYSTSQSDTTDLFIKDKECEVFIGKISSVNRPKTFNLAFFGPDWWSMMDELAIRPGQYFALTLVCRGKFSIMVFNNAGEALTACENYASYVLRNLNYHIGQEPGAWLDLDYGVASGFGFILARTQVWRMDSYALKFADDILLGIFMNVLAVILVFRVTRSTRSLIHATTQIQAWGKPVWTSVDDVLLLAPVLKHVVSSLVA
uniref:Uncharacterized protein n=1 Tax=Tanacetum cinerariifolium TaxID=118510 RepID=A0A6L2KBP0_TANCI|nr:hypothetical protein [Tanacetum cinerariifolium]